MRDKIIINIISKIYFTIVSLLFFIFFSLSVLFIVLQNGLYIDSITTPNVKVKQLYIKWNEKLDVSIKEALVISSNDKNTSKVNLETISKYLKKLPQLYNIFEKISINKVTYNEFSSSFKYERGKDGYFLLSSPDFKLNSSLSFVSDSLQIQINNLADTKRDINISGTVILSPTLKNFTTSVVVDIHNEASLNLLAYVNQKQAYYKLKSLNNIKSIDYIIKQFQLDKDIEYWANEAIEFSSLELHNVYGWVNFDKLNQAYKNIYVSASGHNLKYTYNKNLDRIHTKKTELIFQNGTLFIYPKQASTYKSKLGSSWLEIDFTKPEELLTIYLSFYGKLDQDTLNILKQYKVKVPVIQNTGKTKVDLTLKINLRTINVDAEGVFFTRVANFKYYGYDIDVFNTKVKLKNYDIHIKKMLVKYKNIIDTKVDFSYNAKTEKGLINFDISKFNLDKLDLKLIPQSKYLKASYSIRPNKQTLYITQSHWNYNGYDVVVDKLSFPINTDTLTFNLPKTLITSKQIGRSYIKGKINIKEEKAKLEANVQDIYFGEIELTEKNNFFTLEYDEGLSVTTKDIFHFHLNSEKSFLNPFKISLKDDILILDETYLNIGNLFKTKLNAYYNISKKQGFFQRRRTRFSTNELGLLYFDKDSSKYTINTSPNGTVTIESKELEIKLANTKKMWYIDFSSLHLLSLRSNFLKNNHFTNGSIRLKKMKNEKDIRISSTINYPYPFLIKNNIPIHTYKLKGKFNTSTNSLTATLNNVIDIKIHNTIDITTKDIGLDMNAILDISNSFTNDSKDSSNLKMSVHANNSYLYISENRRILSEHIYLYYEHKILTAGLLYKNGNAGLRYENNKFYAYGENFNDDFMDKLFALSDFDGGKFEFTLHGSLQDYSGVFTINDSTILDYKVLNNILAFVNTIPALTTFSTPGYNSKGLYLQTAYMKFSAQDNIFNISDIYFHSKELDILGKGTASFKTNDIDISLKLRTDIGSNIAKIPLVGYLILDGDSLSSTLKVSGALNNPKVDTLIGEEIIIAPLNLLLRTLTLPYYLISGGDEI